MAQTAIDYDAVERGAQDLSAAFQRVKQKQDNLQQMINRFTTEQFKTDTASGKLAETMQRFKTACERSEQKMEAMGSYLRDVIRQYTEEDQAGGSRFGGIGGV
jgi:predicted  nucleic acid-binding Zn-ribbon protein